MREINGPIMWDTIYHETEIDRNACKGLIYAMLFGSDLMSVIAHYGLSTEEVVRVRMAFDKYTYENRDKSDD